MNRFSAVLQSLLIAALVGGAAHAAEWPTKPLRIVVPFPAGGSYDTIARTLAPKLERRLGQAVTVENISGGATVPGVLSVLNANADGHSLLLASDGSLNINPHTIPNLPYNPDTQLTPVTVLNTVPHWVVSRPGGKFSSFSELGAYIRANPGKVSISVNAVGGAAHLGLASWRQQNQLDFAIVPYRGSPPAMTDLIGGRTDAHVDVIGSSVSYVTAGKIKPLGVLQRSAVAQFPELEKQNAQDGRSLLVRANLALVVKAGTPAAVIDRLYREVKASVQEPDFQARLQSLAYEPLLSTPAEARAFILGETARYGEIARSVKLETQ